MNLCWGRSLRAAAHQIRHGLASSRLIHGCASTHSRLCKYVVGAALLAAHIELPGVDHATEQSGRLGWFQLAQFDDPRSADPVVPIDVGQDHLLMLESVEAACSHVLGLFSELLVHR